MHAFSWLTSNFADVFFISEHSLASSRTIERETICWWNGYGNE